MTTTQQARPATRPPSVKATCHSGGSMVSAGPEAPVVALVGGTRVALGPGVLKQVQVEVVR